MKNVVLSIYMYLYIIMSSKKKYRNRNILIVPEIVFLKVFFPVCSEFQPGFCQFQRRLLSTQRLLKKYRNICFESEEGLEQGGYKQIFFVDLGGRRDCQNLFQVILKLKEFLRPLSSRGGGITFFCGFPESYLEHIDMFVQIYNLLEGELKVLVEKALGLLCLENPLLKIEGLKNIQFNIHSPNTNRHVTLYLNFSTIEI